MDETCDRIAREMGCEPDSGDGLVEAVRLLVQEREAERAKVARFEKSNFDGVGKCDYCKGVAAR